MPKAAALKAGRGFIVKHAGDWFRVPKKLVKSGKVDSKALLKHNDEMLKKMNAKRVAKGKAPLKKFPKAGKRDLFMGKTPGRNSPQGQKVRQQMKAEGRYRSRRGKEEFMDADGNWQPVSKADMGHKTSAVDFWNHGDPPKYPTPGRDAGPRSPYVRRFMEDANNYEFQMPGPNRSDGATYPDYLDPK